jgi:glycosyltransferase involved in cell wall biosynthesis
MQYLISVIMTVFNQEKYLPEAIESVLNQTYKDFELVIVDDGSSDNCPEIIRSYAQKDKRIIPVFQQNSGRAQATDVAVKHAQGKYLAIFDPDDIMLPYRLEKQITLHLSDPEIHASSSYQICISEKGHQFGVQQYPGPFSKEDCNKARTNKEAIMVPITAMMLTKASFILTGGLRDEFFLAEDLDFFNRLIDKGFNLVVIPEPLVKYREHLSSVSQKKPFLQYQKVDWTYHCIMLRRSGKPEISFEAFLEKRKNESSWKKLQRIKFWYCSVLCKRSRLALMAKNYPGFVWNLSVATILSPNIVLRKLQKSTIKK